MPDFDWPATKDALMSLTPGDQDQDQYVAEFLTGELGPLRTYGVPANLRAALGRRATLETRPERVGGSTSVPKFRSRLSPLIHAMFDLSDAIVIWTALLDAPQQVSLTLANRIVAGPKHIPQRVKDLVEYDRQRRTTSHDGTPADLDAAKPATRPDITTPAAKVELCAMVYLCMADVIAALRDIVC